MTGGFEAAGDAMTGAAIARAIEPAHGEGHGDAHGACLNCAAMLSGPFCHQCGQAAHLHRSLMSLWHDIAHGVFHFEGKIWRTLPMLVWRPGELTRRYIHGERARFVSPLALFLFTVFLMFGVISAFAGHLHAPQISAANKGKSVAQIRTEHGQRVAQRADLTRRLALARANHAPEAQIDSLDAERDQVDQEIDGLEWAQGVFSGGDFTAVGFRTGWQPLDDAIKRANENPNLLLYKLQSSAYKYSWALILLSIPFVWLLFFWKRQYKLYDHAIFVTYSLTFMMLLVVVLTTLGYAGFSSAVISIAGVFIPPIHTYRQLRGAYRIGRIGAGLRTVLLMLFGSIVLTLFVVLLIALGVMG